MAEDFYSFEKVLKELHLQEEQLKKLVSEGEIRAFRDEEKMKFKKEDIDRFRKKFRSDLPTIEAPTEELTEELFGDDDGGGDDVGMVTQQISDKSFLEEDAGDVEAIELDEPAGRPGRRPAAARPARAARRIEPVAPAGEGTGMQVVLVLAAVVLLYGVIVAFNSAETRSTAMTKGWSDFVAGQFMQK